MKPFSIRFTHWWALLASSLILLGSSPVVRSACTSGCLHVFSLEPYCYPTSPRAKAIVKLDGSVSTRSAVVGGRWTKPDGTTQTSYSIIGTRNRAEIQIYFEEWGTYDFEVISVTRQGVDLFKPSGKTTMTIDAHMTVDSSCTAGPTPTPPTSPAPTPPVPTPTISVSEVKLSEKNGDVRARVIVIDEDGDPFKGATVEGVWTLPDTSTVTITKTTNSKGKAWLKTSADDDGTYEFAVVSVVAEGHTSDDAGLGTMTIEV
jgi:hypothetical protein